MTHLTGLILAGGRGERYGGPKALARTPSGLAWLTLVATTLGDVVDDVVAVVPAGLDAATRLLPATARAVQAPTDSVGLSDSIRSGIAAIADTGADAAVITTVDMPGLPVDVLRRVIGPNAGVTTLRRAIFDGRPGHPVVIGREHWSALLATLHGDTGAGEYLRAQSAVSVECSDLFHGHDIDT